MSSQTRTRPPFVLARAQVRAVQKVAPNFVRVTFGGTDLDDFGTPGDTYDARIKLIFPTPDGALPPLHRDTEDWWGAYLALPEDERGSMRTYSIRELRVSDAGTEVVIDFVLHMAPGLTGPASTWASAATVGDELLIVGPRRGREGRGGIEYAPGDAASVVLIGDETAAPAIARILEDAPRDVRGIAFIEVPHEDDALPIDAPEGVEVHWLARGDVDHGLRLLPTVLDYLGGGTALEVRDLEGEDLVWETPVYSGLGEDLGEVEGHIDRYFWIAGESGVVTTLRRHLVKELGVDRRQVAFMGYWRRGVAMRG